MKIFVDQDLGIADATVGFLEICEEFEIVESYELAETVISFKHPMVVQEYDGTDKTIIWVAPVSSIPLGEQIKAAAEKVDIVVAPTNFAINVLKAAGLTNVYDSVIPFSFNQELYHPVDEEEKAKLKDEYGLSEKTVVGYSGPHDSHVNLMELIFAFKEMNLDDGVLLLHTQVDAPYADFNLLALIENMEMGESVMIIDGPASADVYQVMDVLVHPTSAEFVAFQCMRALACGIPCVTTQYGGQLDYFDKEASLIPVDDYEVMSDNSHWAVINKNSIREAIQNALDTKYVCNVDKFTHDKVQPLWYELLEGIK